MKRLSVALTVLIVALIADGRPGLRYAAQPQVAPAEFVADEILVKFRPGVDEFGKDMARFRVAGARLRVFPSIPGLEVVKLGRGVSVEEAVAIYQQDPNVLYAEPNYIVRTMLTPNDPSFASQWALNNIGESGGTPDADIDAPEAWEHTTGSSEVIVAVIDSGIDYNHPELSANMFRNEADCNTNKVDDDKNGYVNDCYGIDTHNKDTNPMDDNNHGTHVAGIIGAKGNNSAGVAGINWDIKMMACKFVGSNGSGTIAAAIECMEYVKMMKDRGHNIVATNNSWGGGGFSQAMYDAIEAHRQRGILFIAAAGNGDPFFGFPINNDQTPFYPCSYDLPNVICVASTTRTDARSSFSNYGRRTVHIGAPGSDILSTVRNKNYATLSGTSMATPHVTGVAALLKAQNPNRDWRAIKNLILAGGDNISSMANTITQKRLNANNALTCSNRTVISRVRPIPNTIGVTVGTPIDLSVLHINCASPNGNVTVTVEPGGENVTLVDDGIGQDHGAGDGIFWGQWVPSAEGVYTLSFPDGDAVTVGVGDPKVTATPTAIGAGGTLTAAWSGIALPTAKDWIGLYKPGASHSPSIAWKYTTGTASGEVPFTIPSTVAAGTYELRLFANDGYTLLAVSEPITVTAPPPATLSVSPTTIQAGGTVTASWSGITSPTAKDWIGLYKPGASHSPSIAWKYTTGTASGEVPFTIPSTVAAGTYELRLFANDGYTLLAVSEPITVTAPPPATLSVSPTTIQAGGTVTASWSGIASPTAKDWIGLYKPGASHSPSIAWKYTTGTASGEVPFTIPSTVAAGTYELRLFANNGYTLLAISGPVTIISP